MIFSHVSDKEVNGDVVVFNLDRDIFVYLLTLFLACVKMIRVG